MIVYLYVHAEVPPACVQLCAQLQVVIHVCQRIGCHQIGCAFMCMVIIYIVSAQVGNNAAYMHATIYIYIYINIYICMYTI